MARLNPSRSQGVDLTDLETNVLLLEDAVTAPATITGKALLYVDTSDGDLKVKFGDGYVGTVSFDSDASWTGLSYSNSWVDFGGALATGEYLKHANGLVEVKGTVKDGTATTGTVIATLPAGFRPGARRSFPADSNGAFGKVTVDSNGEIKIVVGSNTALALDLICFFSEG